MANHDKTRETRIRRMAKRQALDLVKSRTRDPRAVDYGCFMLTDPWTNHAAVFGLAEYGRPAASLDEVEAYLNGEGRS
jgi:hypothetical protein